MAFNSEVYSTIEKEESIAKEQLVAYQESTVSKVEDDPGHLDNKDSLSPAEND